MKKNGLKYVLAHTLTSAQSFSFPALPIHLKKNMISTSKLSKEYLSHLNIVDNEI